MCAAQFIDPDPSTPEIYEIRVQGHLHRRRTGLFEGLTITLELDGSTTLRGPLPDQTALHGVLLRIRDMNLKLISVCQVSENAEGQPKTGISTAAGSYDNKTTAADTEDHVVDGPPIKNLSNGGDRHRSTGDRTHQHKGNPEKQIVSDKHNSDLLILVSGAADYIGLEVVKELATRGSRVRALVGNLEAATYLAGRGVEIILGDLGEAETMEAAFHDARKIFLSSPCEPDQVQLQMNAIQAAKCAQVERVVLVSRFGAALDSTLLLSRRHAEVERHLQRSGLIWTILRPTSLMQNHLLDAASIKEEARLYSTLRDVLVAKIDARDVADVAVLCLTEPGHECKTYHLTGPAALTGMEIAAAFSKVFGKEITLVPIPIESLGAAMAKRIGPGWRVEALKYDLEHCAAGSESDASSVFQDLTGKTGRTIEEFARDFREYFR